MSHWFCHHRCRCRCHRHCLQEHMLRIISWLVPTSPAPPPRQIYRVCLCKNYYGPSIIILVLLFAVTYNTTQWGRPPDHRQTDNLPASMPSWLPGWLVVWLTGLLTHFKQGAQGTALALYLAALVAEFSKRIIFQFILSTYYPLSALYMRWKLCFTKLVAVR